MAVIEQEQVEVPVLDPVDEALLKAERYIREHGWCQGMPVDEAGRVCMVGALFSVAEGPGDFIYKEAIKRLSVPLATQPTKMRAVSVWNDARGRTVEEVYALFQKAREVK